MYREVIPSSFLSRIRALTPIVNDAIYGLNAQRYENLFLALALLFLVWLCSGSVIITP